MWTTISIMSGMNTDDNPKMRVVRDEVTKMGRR